MYFNVTLGLIFQNWVTFTAAVDSNSCLTPGQKLNYLHAQLQGDAELIAVSHCVTISMYIVLHC